MRRWPAIAGFAVVCAGCAGVGDSPREPHAVPPPGAYGAAAGRENPFRIVEPRPWADTLGRPIEFDAVLDATAAGSFGVFTAERFRAATSDCDDCNVPAAALAWFEDELVAVPETPLSGGRPALGEDLAERGEGLAERGEDLAELGGGLAALGGDRPPPPAVLWLGAPHVIEHATLGDDARSVIADGTRIPLAIPPPLPTNSAYVDTSTARFFSARPVRIRGATVRGEEGPLFVARSLWPEDAELDISDLELEPLAENERLGTLIEAQMGAADGAFPSRLLLEQGADEGRDWAGRPVVAFVLSGAQGDDDGAMSGHLAVATGVLGPNGEWHDLIANNFYPLIERNAKGIVPASLPMENYLLDLNSGQLLYRPGYMLVAVLRRPRVAHAVQAALQETMLQLYCGGVEFDLARFNSTAMTIEPLRALGWRIPRTGPTSRLAPVLVAPLAVLAGRGFGGAGDLSAALLAERTRLLPRVAFEVAGHDLLYLAAGGARAADEALTPFERMFAEDVEAIVFVRLPQIPSARRFGTYPVRSLLSYGAALLADPGPFETAPETGTRDVPPQLADPCPAPMP